MASISSQLEEISLQLENHTCPVCFDVMVPPVNAPFLLIPCGHTFCKQCVLRCGESSPCCPLCRSNIDTKALNHSLQEVIRSLFDKQLGLQKQREEKERDQSNLSSAENVARYEQKLQLYSTRCLVLGNRVGDLKTLLQGLTHQADSAVLVTQHFEAERTKLRYKMEALQKEMRLVDEHCKEQQDKYDEVAAKRQGAIEQLQMTSSTLEAITRDRDKYELVQLRKTGGRPEPPLL
jgi:hypothetical protein